MILIAIHVGNYNANKKITIILNSIKLILKALLLKWVQITYLQ